MRATTGRVAVVTLLLIGVSGCTSGPSWSWWHKKPDANAVGSTDAPKFNPNNPTLPSATQNPSNSLASAARPGTSAAFSVPGAGNPAGPAGMSGYGATPAAYQNSVYPTTPYQPARLSATSGASAATPSNPWSSPVTSWNSGVQNPGPAVGYGANSAMPGRYAPGMASAAPPSYSPAPSAAAPPNCASNSAIAMASAPAYVSGASTAAAPGYGGSAVPPRGGAQPQAGFYNPTYDGGGPATRYASGGAIPGATPSATMVASAAASPPSSSLQNYRTADARSTISSVGPMTSPASNNDNNELVGDRYAGSMNATTGATASNVAPTADRYIVPAAAPAAAASGMSGAPDRYAQPAGDYQPAAAPYNPASGSYQPGTTAAPPGNSSYNPTQGSAMAAATGIAAVPGLPARGNTEYRPGGTSNYVSPTANPVQPGSSNGAQPDNHLQNSVTPASFQSAETGAGRSLPGASLASAYSAAPVTSEVYGAYQGGTSQATSSQGSAYQSTSAGGSASEPAYGSPNTTTATPALLPAHSGW